MLFNTLNTVYLTVPGGSCRFNSNRSGLTGVPRKSLRTSTSKQRSTEK